MSTCISGYQAGILFATGCYDGSRYVVRNVDRWYCDCVQPIFGTTVYTQIVRDKPQYVVKGNAIKTVDISSISDAPGFCRAYIELKSSFGLWQGKDRRGRKTNPKPRLRIYGSIDTLERLMDWLPAAPKKIQLCTGQHQDGYTGRTYAVYYQSAAEIIDIFDYISGSPRNDPIWGKWEDILSVSRGGKK